MFFFFRLGVYLPGFGGKSGRILPLRAMETNRGLELTLATDVKKMFPTFERERGVSSRLKKYVCGDRGVSFGSNRRRFGATF